MFPLDFWTQSIEIITEYTTCEFSRVRIMDSIVTECTCDGWQILLVGSVQVHQYVHSYVYMYAHAVAMDTTLTLYYTLRLPY